MAQKLQNCIKRCGAGAFHLHYLASHDFLLLAVKAHAQHNHGEQRCE
jgi:hypothetical protein